MKPSSDITDRIYAAADSLFEQGGRAAFPTVDAVRKAARVNMNDANSGMREWRRNQLARAVSAPVQVPAVIAQAQAALVAELWQAAQAAAGESLAVAQAAWDAERQQLESLNKEMADAFELQAAELDAARGESLTLSAQAESAVKACAQLRLESEALQARLTAAENDAKREAVRVEEVTRRAGELRQELDHAHRELVAAHAAESEAKRDAVRLEEVTRRADELRQELDHARQELAAAHAGGREARRAHAEELLAVRTDARLVESMLREEVEASRQQQHKLMQIVSGVTVAANPGDAPYNDMVGP